MPSKKYLIGILCSHTVRSNVLDVGNHQVAVVGSAHSARVDVLDQKSKIGVKVIAMLNSVVMCQQP